MSRHGRPQALAERNFEVHADRLRGKTLKEIFTFIHETNLWGAETSRSGLGSELQSTETLRQEIGALFKRLKIKTLLDIPCGDFGWLRHVPLEISNYIGVDILESKITDLSREFSLAESTINYGFMCLDITVDRLPPADLILCRDGLVHLSFDSIFKALRNIKQTKSKYLLATTFADLKTNIDIQDGDWRPLNLEVEPFNFPKSTLLINEQCTEVNGAYADKSLGLWEIKDLL